MRKKPNLIPRMARCAALKEDSPEENFGRWLAAFPDFDELHLEAISAYCFPFNQRSGNILEKCNFAYEGTLKMAEKLFNGNIYDNECYLLTAPRYQQVEVNEVLKSYESKGEM
jgi:hypothetical protein